MQERVTAQDSEFGDVVVQFSPDLMTVGVGIEPRVDIPSKHFIDAIYGDAPTQTEIGKILAERLKSELSSFPIPQFTTNESANEWYDNLGRYALDAVTGSKSTDGYWSWLDRPGVNRLIRLLRKSRDSAFGRDE